MKPARSRLALWLSLIAVALFAFAARSGHTAPKTHPAAGRQEPAGSFTPAAFVRPFIGTGKGPGGTINLFPGPSLPFGMVQLSPDTEARGYGYHYDQPDIQGFSMTHMSGPGCDNEGDVFFTATTGPVHTQIKNFQSPYSHSEESARPGYYRVKLTRWDTGVELTATRRAGLARFRFPAGRRANVLVPISHTLNYTVGAQVHVASDHEITGYVKDHCFCGSRQTYTVYFDMVFSEPFSSFGVWRGNLSGAPAKLSPGSRVSLQTEHQQWIGAYASWPFSPRARTVTVRVGISYVDLGGATRNLRAETQGKSFAEIRTAAWDAWNKALSVIRVSGGAPGERRMFYTALYHCLLMPSVFSDVDGRYMGFDGKIHRVSPGHQVYANYSGWDIYRSEMPLLALLVPRRFQDMCQSIVLMYQQGGWIGRWPQLHHYTNVMAGSPLTTVLAMAWLDGLHGFDIQAAWRGMVKDATTAPPPGKPYQGEASIDWINKIHYVPNDKQRYGSVSQLQEDAIAYASLYDLAKARHDAAAARLFYRRALYVRNVFDSADRFFRPRNADGKWVPDFNPAQEGHGFIEGSGWHYQWLAPFDLHWLIGAVGRSRFNRRLRAFFSYQKPGWHGRYYNPYNETDLEAPFEFEFSGEPWESQRVVRKILRQNFTLSVNGIPGNDDCGEMSSWAVLSMMGIYTVDPASTAYELVSPVFSRVTIALRPPYFGREFTIETAPQPATHPYIQKVSLDGRTVSRDWVRFADLTRGGELLFTLGRQPNRSWGAAPADAPPSLSEQQP
jgi:predicted alpha-1,2-mannosidase